MPEIQNRQPEETKAETAVKPEVAPPASPLEPGHAVTSSGGQETKLKKLLGYVVKALDYIDEEEPAPPRPADAPESGLKKAWKRFNAFLDALEAEEPGQSREDDRTFGESVSDFKVRWRDPESRGGMLKKAGGFCWTLFFLGMIACFLFVLTLYGTVKALDYVDEHRVRLYPPDEVMEYVAAEHESLERTAYPLTSVSGKCEDIPLERFDAKCREVLKPLKIYSDEYGVYLMTSKDWYAGEHGIFIARDEDKMPQTLNWYKIEGRVFAYGIYD